MTIDQVILNGNLAKLQKRIDVEQEAFAELYEDLTTAEIFEDEDAKVDYSFIKGLEEALSILKGGSDD
jgi:hypothetical protein